MREENRQFMEHNRHFHETLIRAGYMKGLNAHEREGMLRVMQEEFQPRYLADLWCPNCVADLVRHVYREYDTWLAANQTPSVETEQPGSKKKKASFPSHKKPS